MFIYANGTQIFCANKDPNKIEEAINIDLASIGKWYDENGMRRNPEKYQAMVIGKIRQLRNCYVQYIK